METSKMKKVSIIVPCYKVEKYLPRCLDSLVSQTLDDIEIICINDGSPDHCIDILRQYEARFPGKIVVIDKENEGVWRGRQDAISIAKGEYIGFLDSDDYAAPTMIEDLYTAAKNSSADISVCGFYRVDAITDEKLTEEMSDIRPSFSISEEPKKLLQLNGAPWNKLFKAPLLKGMYDFKNPPKIFDDMMMHLLVYPDADRVCFVPKALIYYRIRNDSIMTTIGKEKVESTYSCMKEVKKLYNEKPVSSSLGEFLDLAAFLHLGISLMFRLAYDPTADLRKLEFENREFLDTNFSMWRTVKIPLDDKAMRKVALSRFVYKFHLLRPSLSLYRFMIDKLGVDIKW